MRIRTSFEEITKGLTMATKMVSVKGLQEDMKVLNIEVVNGDIRVVVTDSRNYCLYTLEGEVQGDIPLFAVYVKEVTAILDKYKTLQRTEVASVELVVEDTKVVMRVEEKIKNGVEMLEGIRLDAEYTIAKERPKKLVVDEIAQIKQQSTYETIEMSQLGLYIDYLQPLINIPRYPDNVHFKEDKVYVVLGSVYGVEMPNVLPEAFQGISISPPTFNMLKEIQGKGTEMRVSREDLLGREGAVVGVILTLSVEEYCFRVKTGDTTSNVRLDAFTEMPDTSITVDKLYFMDILKRVMDAENLQIMVDLDRGEMNLRTDRIHKHPVPIKKKEGKGQFGFVVNPKQLVNVVFSHINKTPDGERVEEVELGVRLSADKRTVELTCRDNTGTWMTKYPRAIAKDFTE